MKKIGATETKYHRKTKRHVVKISIFLFLFIVLITMKVIFSRKTGINHSRFGLLAYSAAPPPQKKKINLTINLIIIYVLKNIILIYGGFTA